MSNKPENWIWLELLTETSLEDKQKMYPDQFCSQEGRKPPQENSDI